MWRPWQLTIMGLVAVAAVWLGSRLATDFSPTIEPSELQIFHQLDSDGSGHLSLSEFLPFLHRCQRTTASPTTSPVRQELKSEFRPNEEVVCIQAFFRPLVLQSLSKEVTSLSPDEMGTLQGLVDWKQPARQWRRFPVRSFALFLPSGEVTSSVVGTSWWVIPPSVHQDGPLRSDRYFPPEVDSKFHLLRALLQMLHDRPFLHTRFGPQGTVAVLRAVGQDVVDILFRMHAEFQLNVPPKMPFWFTPAQLKGRLITNTKATRVHYFSMSLPADRKLNVDMEWLNGPTEADMEVDIGYLPEMTLNATGPSAVPSIGPDRLTEGLDCSKIHAEGATPYKLSQLQFISEIPLDTGYSLLEQLMYPFKKVQYHNFTDAFSLAEKQQKLVHAILLWGALDDQSC